MLKKFFFYLCLFFSNFAYSQNNSDDLKAMFDDGNISTSKNIFKVNPTALSAGDFPLFYERVIFKNLTVEMGLGYIFNMKTYELYIPSEIPHTVKGNGYSVWINPRIYFARKAPEGYFFGFLYRKRSYSSQEIHNDFAINNGFQISSGRGRLMWEIMYGAGVRFIENNFLPSGYYEELSKVKFIFPASIKIGFKI